MDEICQEFRFFIWVLIKHNGEEGELCVCMFNKIVAHFLSLIFAQGNPADSVNAAINCRKHYQSPISLRNSGKSF